MTFWKILENFESSEKFCKILKVLKNVGKFWKFWKNSNKILTKFCKNFTKVWVLVYTVYFNKCSKTNENLKIKNLPSVKFFVVSEYGIR